VRSTLALVTLSSFGNTVAGGISKDSYSREGRNLQNLVPLR
jgi:hypothetical protein